MKLLLLPIAFFYHIVLSIRHKLYDWQILKSTKFQLPIIGVGNLNLGGTGKTPMVEYLIKLLKDQYNIATLSRGYGRKTKGFQKADSQSTYETIGDEPLQYFNNFPEIQVAVDEDRVEGVEHLLWEQGVIKTDVILLDDAFQHRSIKAGLDILLTEYRRIYTKDFLFPAGTLRDIKSAAHRANIIIVSKSPKDLDEKSKADIVTQLKPQAHQKVFFSYLEYQTPKPLNEKAKEFEFNSADSVLVFSGIANSEPLINELNARFKTIDTLTFGDHHAYTENDIKTILERYDALVESTKIILTTEKDAARLTNSPYLCQFKDVPLYDLPIAVRFYEEEKFNEEILKYVRKNSNDRWLHQTENQ